jgi:murein DD-endopeptidase MepM/ murein hydrolase activator NlpD
MLKNSPEPSQKVRRSSASRGNPNMARVVTALLLILVSGAFGYYLGYNAGVAKLPAPTSATREVPQPERDAERSRSQPATPPRDTAQPHVAAPESTPTLGAPNISLPLANLKASDILNTFDQARGAGERRHEATDIMAPRGTPIYAVDDGVIRKLFLSKPGGLTVYQYDPTEQYTYYYAHLDRYAEGLHEGQSVKRGDLIGYVGSTGNADPNAPHLHFAILQLGPTHEWWHDTVPINPYPYLIAALNRR